MFKPCKLFLVTSFLVSFSAYSQSVKLDNIDSSELKSIIGDFSANFMHTTVSGASSLGDIFGLELGLVGGVTNVPKIDEYTKQTDPSANADKAIHAAIIGQVSVPLGFTIEGSLIPKMGNNDFKFGTFGLAGKWTPTDVFLNWPFSAALRVFVNKTTVQLEQTVSSVTQNLEMVDTQKGAAIVVSKNLGIVEPYFTFGSVTADGELSGAAIFNGDLAGQTSASASKSSAFWALGLEVKLLVIRLGAEYTKLYDTGRMTGKMSFYF